VKKKGVICLFLSLGFLYFANAVFASEIKFHLQKATIDSVQTAIKKRRLTCVQLVERYLDRIKKYNLALNRGAPINAYASINPSVLSEAKKLDEYFASTGKLIGPLHCIPVIVKDNIDTIDSPSTSGSLSMLGSQPNRDAFLVKKLREAGAVILGKGAMDEFASGMIGVSSRSGRVGNTFEPLQNSGGSSAGVAAAVSANFAMIGIGTDNSGSIRIPAAYNGVYGLRPSTGLVSQSGVFPRGNLDGLAGPIARNVKDLAIVLAVIAQSDPSDLKTVDVPRVDSFTKKISENFLKGKRIGVIQSVAKINVFKSKKESTNKIFSQALEKFKALGATLVDIKLDKFDTNRKNNMAGEVQEINRYLASFPSTRKDFKDICQSGRTQIFEGVKGCVKHIRDTTSKNSKAYRRVVKMFVKNRDYVQAIMKDESLDVLIMPINTNGAASYDLSGVNTARAPVSSNSGLPSMTIIAGYTAAENSMPVGMELIGKMYDEQALIAMANEFAANTKPHLLPQLGTPADEKLMTYSISQLNNLFTRIGYMAFNKVLLKGKPEDLSAKKFTSIVKGYLEQR